MSDTKPYMENENFVPEPTAQFGTLDTSGTAGAAHARLEEITPVFEVADKQNAVNAAKALDPDDDSVPASLVVLPDSDLSYDEAVERVQTKASKAEEKDVSLLANRTTMAQEQAQQEGEEGEATANAQRAGQGAAGGLDGSGTGETRGSAEDDKTGDDKAAKKTASSKK